jgi:hypothetical protein
VFTASAKTSVEIAASGGSGGARSSVSGGSDGSLLEAGGVIGEDGEASGIGGLPDGGGSGGWTAYGCGVAGEALPLATRRGGKMSNGEVGETPWALDGVEERERVGRGTPAMELGQRSRRRPERWPEPP